MIKSRSETGRRKSTPAGPAHAAHVRKGCTGWPNGGVGHLGPPAAECMGRAHKWATPKQTGAQRPILMNEHSCR
jgi:hypothetical protein